MRKRLIFVYFLIALMSLTLLVRTSAISAGNLYGYAERTNNELTVYAPSARGNIYDCLLNELNNTKHEKYAVIVPTQQSVDLTYKYAEDFQLYRENVLTQTAFCTKIIYGDYFNKDVHVFDIISQNDENKLSTHILGYCNDDGGICGLEYAYNDILENYAEENSVTYQINGVGEILDGEIQTVVKNEIASGGIVTTLDKDIIEICNSAAKGNIDKGSIVVMDITNGDIKALLSYPTYSYSDINEVMYDENSPMINRALYSYSVGSIFKLVIAAAAIDCGLENFEYECIGYTQIGTQMFKCHDIAGHGMQNMCDAVVNSCNPYFIELTKQIDAEVLREYALAFGFGTRIDLAKSISSMGGTLPTLEQLEISAEKANFSFGQGFLTATPLQICKMTCGIASYGEMPNPRLYLGTTDDGVNIEYETQSSYSYCCSVSTARKLRDFMDSVVNDSENSSADAFNTTCAAKTSTAQTGRYDENGVEYCHSWITGYFPAEKPQYAVTVLVEDGGYGNLAAAPIFKYIAEEITMLEEMREISKSD